MSRPTPEEISWAKECLAAGDTLEEIAAWSGRGVDSWRVALGRLARITPLARAWLALADAGHSQVEIARLTGSTAKAIGAGFCEMRRRGLPVPLGRSAGRAA